MRGRRLSLSAAIVPVLVALAACKGVDPPEARRRPGGNPDAGRRAVMAIDCGICHVIPGIAGARGIVGPSLEQFGSRPLIAGIAPNEPATLARWVRDAPSMAPDTAMPALPLDELQSRDVAAFLYTLR
ncbi:MAG: cytochrome C [Xanthobacteraceae bacterium]